MEIRNPTFKEDSYDGISDNRASQSYDNLGNYMSGKHIPQDSNFNVYLLVLCISIQNWIGFYSYCF